MKLIASLIVRNELDRYLKPCIEHLLEFCDEIRVTDDASTDGTAEWLAEQDRVEVVQIAAPSFFAHEGRARNAALAWTMGGNPSHILALDADEFVTDGAAIRRACEADKGRGVWSLGLEEVWRADERNLYVREDGGWRAQANGIPILWRAPQPRAAKTTAWQVADRALACGREPVAVRRLGRALPSGSAVLHFGWSCEADRAARYARYVEHDGGRFHRNAHLDSIMWPDDLVRLRRRPWPPALAPFRDAIVARGNRRAVPA